jgi:hypothetical protein
VYRMVQKRCGPRQRVLLFLFRDPLCWRYFGLLQGRGLVQTINRLLDRAEDPGIWLGWRGCEMG